MLPDAQGRPGRDRGGLAGRGARDAPLVARARRARALRPALRHRVAARDPDGARARSARSPRSSTPSRRRGSGTGAPAPRRSAAADALELPASWDSLEQLVAVAAMRGYERGLLPSPLRGDFPAFGTGYRELSRRAARRGDLDRLRASPRARVARAAGAAAGPRPRRTPEPQHAVRSCKARARSGMMDACDGFRSCPRCSRLPCSRGGVGAAKTAPILYVQGLALPGAPDVHRQAGLLRPDPEDRADRVPVDTGLERRVQRHASGVVARPHADRVHPRLAERALVHALDDARERRRTAAAHARNARSPQSRPGRPTGRGSSSAASSNAGRSVRPLHDPGRRAGSPRNITRNPSGVGALNPDWSPNGKLIVFQRDEEQLRGRHRASTRSGPTAPA